MDFGFAAKVMPGKRMMTPTMKSRFLFKSNMKRLQQG
jgi:hypothetical protein